MGTLKEASSENDLSQKHDSFIFSQKQIDDLYKSIKPRHITSPVSVEVLGKLTMLEREEFSLRTGTMALYLGPEVQELQKAEETSALNAMPKGYPIEQLNGINVGCGDRIINDYLIPVDIMRGKTGATGEHHAHTKRAILGRPNALPFKSESLDFIIALHMLEHVPNPTEVIKHFLDLVKPGGGIGIVIPDWRYTWDARHDVSSFGHKWNGTPALVKQLYHDHWFDLCDLEALDSYPHKLSFDFVLRKPGTFKLFDLSSDPEPKSGNILYKEGSFLHSDI